MPPIRARRVAAETGIMSFGSLLPSAMARMVDAVGGALAGELVILAQEGWQPQRPQMMGEQQLRREVEAVEAFDRREPGLLDAALQHFMNRVVNRQSPTRATLNRELIARVETIDSPRRVVLDMDSTEIRVYGQQEHGAYNGHFESTCYHPLLLFNRDGDCLAAELRPGNVHSAEGWEEVLLPEIKRQQEQGTAVVFRADAAFAKPEIYAALEERDVKYAIRLPANDNLQRNLTELLTRPVERPSYKPAVWFKSFLYQASWKTARRVVAKVEFHCGELFPRVGFIVTNLMAASRAVVRFYNKRGTAEQWIKEGKQR
jgi:hypothetical protein